MSERTFNQISEQYRTSHEPTVLIRRSDGAIQTAYLTAHEDGGGRIVRFTDPADGLEKAKRIMPGNLTDEMQAELADELSASRIDEEASIDTIPRDVLMGQVEKAPEAVESLGEVAVHESVVVDFEPSHETESGEDVKAAEARIMAIIGEDGQRKSFLAEALRKAGDTPGAIRQALADRQSNPELREQVSSVLARRMSDLLAEGGHFHDRVQRNDPTNLKSPEGNHDYDKAKYRSDEYVVLLALAKLDGSFDITKERNNYPDYPADHGSQGQHRQASDTLLESFMRENTPVADEREPTEDETIMEARKAIDTMLVELRPMVQLNEEQFYYMENLLAGMPNLDEMDQQTDELVGRLHRMYDIIQETINTLRQIEEGIDENTLEGVARRHVFELAVQNIRSGLDSLSMDFAMGGISMIDRKTQEARYDNNMQLEYRHLVLEIMGRMRETQQHVLNVLESAQL